MTYIQSGHEALRFPASQVASSNANDLDDYQETASGTVHTATATCSTSGTVTLNSTNNKLQYTKIGRFVHVHGMLVVSAVSSPIGALLISLPVTAASSDSGNSGYTPATVAVSGAAAGFTGVPQGVVAAGTAVLTLTEFSAGSAGATFANRMQASAEIYISVCYSAAT